MKRAAIILSAILAGSDGVRVVKRRGNATVAASSGCVDFLVIGDFGKMNDDQQVVADGMAKVAAEMNPDAILGLGDNIYEVGATSEDQLVREWKDIYLKREALKRPWYLVTGNHDWYLTANAMRTFTYSDKNGGYWNMPNYWYSKRWGDVEVFFVDSQIWRKWVPTWWFEIGKMKDWLRKSMRESDATWKIVVSHHPVHSVGMHGGSGTMQRELDPIMREFGGNIHLSGHDHSQQHIQYENVNYIVSGAGAKKPRGRNNDLPSPDALKNYQGDVGFASLQICDKTSATFKFYSGSGDVAYTTTLKNDKPSTMLAVSSAVARDEAFCQGVEMPSVDMRCSEDGCTVQTDFDNSKQSCGQYCSAQGLACSGAWFNEFEDCGVDEPSACDAVGAVGGSVSQVCRCAKM